MLSTNNADDGKSTYVVRTPEIKLCQRESTFCSEVWDTLSKKKMYIEQNKLIEFQNVVLHLQCNGPYFFVGLSQLEPVWLVGFEVTQGRYEIHPEYANKLTTYFLTLVTSYLKIG